MPDVLDEQVAKKIQLDLESPQILAKKRAIFEIVKLKALEFIPRLQRMAAYDEDVEVRYYASKAVNFLKPPSSPQEEAAPAPAPPTPAEVRDGLKDPDPEVRLKSLQAIAQSGDVGHLPSVLELVDGEKDPVIRSALPLTIAHLGGREHTGLILQKFLHDPHSRVRANAIEALEKIGDPAVFPTIVGFLQDRDNRVRANAALALHRFGKVNLLKTLEEMMQHPKVWMRDSAAFALSIIKLPEAVPLLARVMEDPYAGIRAKAKKGLTFLASRGVKEAQEVLDRHPEVGEEESLDDFLQLAALETGAAGGGGEDSIVELPPQKGIVYELESADASVRAREVEKVVANDDRGMAPRLVERLRAEKDVGVKVALIGGLGQLGYKAALDALMTLLTDGEARIRCAAIDAIARLKMERGFSKLMASLKDEDPIVQIRAVVALKDYPHVNMVRHLEQMVANRREDVRKAAFQAIRLLRTFDTLPLLERLAQDKTSEIRMDTLALLRELSKEGNAVARAILARLGGRGR